MPPSLSPVAARLRLILETEGRGRSQAIPADYLASRVGISERALRDVINELISQGILVGSCQGRRSGVFLIVTRDDLEVGTETLRRHALSVLTRVSALKKAAERQFGPASLHLFNIEEAS
jgi:hypothetical protein